MLGHVLVAHGGADLVAPDRADDDDRRDLMWDGETEPDWGLLQLDPGNDDYLGHGRPDLVDITTSPLLLPA